MKSCHRLKPIITRGRAAPETQIIIKGQKILRNINFFSQICCAHVTIAGFCPCEAVRQCCALRAELDMRRKINIAKFCFESSQELGVVEKFASILLVFP